MKSAGIGNLFAIGPITTLGRGPARCVALADAVNSGRTGPKFGFPGFSPTSHGKPPRMGFKIGQGFNKKGGAGALFMYQIYYGECDAILN